MPAPHLFLSYSHHDNATAQKVASRLQAAGIRVWVDRTSIRGGDLWRQRIVEAIGQVDYFVPMLSRAAMESDNVRREVELATDKRKRIIPLVMDPTPVPASLEYQLAGLQRIDMRDFETGICSLIRMLGADAPPEPERTRPTSPIKGAVAGAALSAVAAVVALLLDGLTGYNLAAASAALAAGPLGGALLRPKGLGTSALLGLIVGLVTGATRGAVMRGSFGGEAVAEAVIGGILGALTGLLAGFAFGRKKDTRPASREAAAVTNGRPGPLA